MEEFEEILNRLAKRLIKHHGISMGEAVKRINALFASGMITESTTLIDSFLAIPSSIHEKVNPRRQA